MIVSRPAARFQHTPLLFRLASPAKRNCDSICRPLRVSPIFTPPSFQVGSYTFSALKKASLLQRLSASHPKLIAMKPKHTPIRTCVACRVSDAKRGLFRLVRQPDGSVLYDPKGKLAGRGAYLCARSECIALAKKQKKLERSFKISSVPQELFEELMSLAHSAEKDKPVLEESEELADGGCKPSESEEKRV